MTFPTRRCFLLLALLPCLIAPAFAQPEASLGDIEIRTLFVEVSDHDSNYTVVDARMDETATAAVFFGVLGAAASSAGAASSDDKKADTLRDAAAKIDLKSLITEAVVSTLSSRGGAPLASDRAGASHTLVIDIRNWGLLRRSQEDNLMRAFLNLTLSLEDEKGRVVWKKERDNHVSQEADVFEAFTEERFTREMEMLAEKSGQYVAYQIIYR